MERVFTVQAPLYGGRLIIKVSNSLYKTCIENTTQFKNVHKNETQLIDDLKNDKVEAMFWLYENDNNKKRKRTYYLFFKNTARVSDIVHECVHLKNSIFNYHSIENSTESGKDEHEAYYLDNLVNMCFKLIYPKNAKLYHK